MGFRDEYGALLAGIAEEADAIAMRYFRADELRIERKSGGYPRSERCWRSSGTARLSREWQALRGWGRGGGRPAGKEPIEMERRFMFRMSGV